MVDTVVETVVKLTGVPVSMTLNRDRRAAQVWDTSEPWYTYTQAHTHMYYSYYSHYTILEDLLV